MSFKSYLYDKLLYIFLLVFVVLSIQVFLIPFEIVTLVRVYVCITPTVVLLIPFFVEYYRKRRFYDELEGKLEELDEKYLISEVISKANFEEGKILEELIRDVDKSMLENVNKYKHFQEEYKEYIELWIHEIKLPIATGKMIIENNKTEVTESINEELDKIEDYIEQVLFYARSSIVEKDYYIKKTNLKDLVNNAIIKNKRSFIQNKVKIEIHDLDIEVCTDSKWCLFILNQILQNSIKYAKTENKEIEIFAGKNRDNIVLNIKDNGIGIPKADISRVFEKGFTGENGRKSGQKSTGIGLYLCKKLCDKLGLVIELNSSQDIGTEVIITFPKSSFIDDVFNT